MSSEEGTEADLEEAYAGTPSGEPVARWNQNGFAALTRGQDVRFQVRGMAMMHIAMHDAANAVDERYGTYVLDGDPYQTLIADPSLAAAKAARDVLVHFRPDMQSQIDTWFQTDLSKVTNANRRQNSLTIGAAAAQAIIQLRANDTCCNDTAYVPGTSPGDYQFTPPFNFAYGTGWPRMRPFAMSKGSQFRTPGPPALTSAQWTADYNEVKAYGSQNSTVRTQQQTFLAYFWVDGSAEVYCRMARNLIAEQNRDLWDSARALALGFIAGNDGAIASFDNKYDDEFWRPITAIRAGDSDGNPDTVGDATWTPAATTPPTPEYTSTHAATCAAVAVALAEVFGDVPAHATSSIVPGEVFWSSLTASALECAEARIWVGYHYRTSIEDGLQQGFAIGDLVSHLLPLDN